MIIRTRITILLLSVLPSLVFAQSMRLSRGLKIHQSQTFRKGSYQLSGSTLDQPVLTISGDSIVLDFKGVTLRGDLAGQLPDTYAGLGMLVKDSRVVTIRGLRIRGFKVGLMAVNVQQLVLEDCDFSYNYRQRLGSTALKEDMGDWMSYHQNENDEWLRYGAAIYLKNCDSARVQRCRVTGGQNALMMTGCNGGNVVNNNFSFNSGIGVGLYRSSGHYIAYNILNFNVRGYSHGIYNRGQDSAGFLVYEQSSQNIFYKNSATHCGDGFFLWAGQTTMDTGVGGCNDNLIVGNNFSYAPTNGIEVTFSRNIISGNRIVECDHGIWGGYSYDTRIADNYFRKNRIAIAIEHGQRNTIEYNSFIEDQEGLRLWARASQPADWGYARVRDTRSHNYRIWKNSFFRTSLAFNFSRTDSIWLFSNHATEVGEWWKPGAEVTGVDSMPNELEEMSLAIPEPAGHQDPFAGSGKLAGRQHIRMTEWGPYDYQRPLIWRELPGSTSDTLQFRLLGPAGQWRLQAVNGLRLLSSPRAKTGDTILGLRLPTSGTQDIRLEAHFRGAAGYQYDGLPLKKGKKQRVRYRDFFQPVQWAVRWYAVDTARHQPLRDGLFPPNVRMVPVKTDSAKVLDYGWWGGIRAGSDQYPQFLTLAEGEATVPAGDYILSVTWDDAVRVYLDGKLILDEWNPALYKFDESPNRRIPVRLGGHHRLRVEHLELGGFATLALRLLPAS